MSVKITGFDKLEKELNRIQRNAEALSGTKEVSFAELFTPGFMSQNTAVSSFDAFLEAGGYRVNSKEDFAAIPEDEFDKYVKANSKFNSWQEMFHSASQAYLAKKLGL